MTDIFRQKHRPLSHAEKDKILRIKMLAQALHDEIESTEHYSNQRGRELALINLEQAVMWAIKSIT